MAGCGCSTHTRHNAGCPECRRLANLYDRRRRKAIAEGTWQAAVPATVVRAHIDTLVAAGMRLLDIAHAAGVSDRTLHATRTRKYTQGPTASAILAVTAAQRSDPAFLDGIGTARRIRALVCMGWTLVEQGRRLGMEGSHVWQLCWQKLPTVTVATAERIQGLFAELWDKPGPSKAARNLAAKHGWAPPLAWDDIDDPADQPNLGGAVDDSVDDGVDEVAVARAARGERLSLTAAEKTEALRLGVDLGRPLSAVSARLGINYADARRMVGVDLSPRREQQVRVEAELVRVGHLHNDFTIAALVGVHHQTVSRARRRLAARQEQLAS